MKESKINNKTPVKIISAAIYSVSSRGPCSGLEGMAKIHQPSVRFSEQVTFPTQQVVHAKQSWCWTHQIYCVYTECLHVTHTPARAGTCSHPNSFLPKPWWQLRVCVQKTSPSCAMLTELETNTYFKSFSSQRQRKQCWDVLT